MSERDVPTRANVQAKLSETSTKTDTGYTFTDDPWIRWRNTWRYLTGGLTDEGVKQYEEGRNARMEESDCRRCEQQRDYYLQYSKAMSGPFKPGTRAKTQ